MSACERRSPLPTPTAAIVQRAADWQALLASGEASAQDRAEGLAWREANPAHELAWQRLERLWQRFDGLPAAPASAALDAAFCPASSVPTSAAPRRRRAPAIGAILGLVALAVGAGAMTGPGRYLRADLRTGGGAPRVFVLEDGTRLTLDAYSGVDLHFGAHERRLELRRGELLVEVAADAARPFVVATPQGTARALGTRYLVRRAAGATEVTVLHSTVRACSRELSCVDLHPGQQVGLGGDAPAPVRQVDAESAAAWTQGYLAVDDRPLVEVLQALQAHRLTRLRYDSARLQHLRVSGVFSLQDTDRALDVLAATLPIRLDRRHDLWVNVEPAAAK